MVVSLLQRLQPLIQTHAGREKLMRFVQYFSAFLVPFLKNMQPNSEWILKLVAKLALVKANMSLSRKIMRFGGEINYTLGIIDRFK